MMIDSSSSGYFYDEEAADLAVEFFPRFLKHTKGEWCGRPFELAPWQADRIIRPLYGWKREDGTRRYRTVFVGVPRKNGKSTLAAGIGVKGVSADGEPGAECYSCAADREQASIVFNVARDMVRLSPKLDERCEIYKRSIIVPSTLSSYRVLSSDASTKHGFNASTLVIDEYHAHRDGELAEVLVTSTGARRQPITVYITTAGYDTLSACFKEWDYARKVRDGIIDDPSYLSVLFEPDEGADWNDPEVWAAVNPSLGLSIKQDYLEERYRKATESLVYQNSFRRLHLNEWTEQAVRWIDMGVWKENDAGSIELEDLNGQVCFAGLDLSSTTDLTALVLVFPEVDPWPVFARFWVPEDTINDRTRRERVPFATWNAQGFLTGTPGAVIDYDHIRRTINDLGQRFDIRELAIDRWNATQLATQLAGDGFQVVGFGQGYKDMSPASKELERVLKARAINHQGNPVLTWCASNAAAQEDAAGNIKPNKAKSADRIDGLVALIMALGRASHREEATSVYESRGMLVW